MSAIDWSKCPAVEKRPDVTTGFYVFKGTRVPLVTFFNHLQNGFDVRSFHGFHKEIRQEDLRAFLAFLTSNSAT